MNLLKHTLFNCILTGSLLLYPGFGVHAADPVTQPATFSELKTPLQEEMQYLTASRLAEEENLTAILWVQRSAEFRGLSYQAYNLATMEVEKAVAQRREIEKALRKAGTDKSIAKQQTNTQCHEEGHVLPGRKRKKTSDEEGRLLPLAVVLDIDDTIVSHARLEMYYVEHPEAKANYTVWEHWIAQHNELLPGAKDFLKYADKSGVQIFYVTGRGPQDKKITEEFLRKAGLPFPDESYLLMNDRSGGKMNHFAKLARRYNVICYLGDNVADFPIGAVRDENAVIYKKETAGINSDSITKLNNNANKKSAANASETEIQSGKRKTNMPLDIQAMLKRDKNAKRNRIIDEYKKSFGTKFILLPNPMYGDWENNLARKFRRLPAEHRIALRKAAMKSFEFKKEPFKKK